MVAGAIHVYGELLAGNALWAMAGLAAALICECDT